LVNANRHVQLAWHEAKLGDLSSRFRMIAKELEATAPTIVKQREEAQRQAEIERKQWEAQCRERDRQERERRRAEATKESRQQLLAIVKAWSLARGIESFLRGREATRDGLNGEEQSAVLDRLTEARAMMGGTDALARFLNGGRRTSDRSGFLGLNALVS
jgi:hypothetical protein